MYKLIYYFVSIRLCSAYFGVSNPFQVETRLKLPLGVQQCIFGMALQERYQVKRDVK